VRDELLNFLKSDLGTEIAMLAIIGIAAMLLAVSFRYRERR